jgi:hypothetical protein
MGIWPQRKELTDYAKCASSRVSQRIILGLPGLFHLKMVVTNAFWQTHVQPQEGHSDLNGFFEYIRHLHPRETGKFLSSRGFQRLHDSIHYAIWIDVLDCWRLKANGLHFGS